MNFSELGLSSNLLKAISDIQYKIPTPIQEQAIPEILKRKDVLAAAQTGTGKTASFMLPILNRIGPKKNRSNNVKAIVLTPTRELAVQINKNTLEYGKYTAIRTTVVYGGVKISSQIRSIEEGVDIIIATPGRFLDIHQQIKIDLSNVNVLVLDEADRMLDMGFIDDIKKIKSFLPKRHQNLMFSATFTEEIRKISKRFLNEPIEIDVNERNQTANTVKHIIYPVDKSNKADLLAYLIKENSWQQVLVFARTKYDVDKLTKYLQKNDISALAIHGDKSQNSRQRSLEQFKNYESQVLVATDVAARGLDIQELPHVVNYDLPGIPEDYIHRIGRTGRAGMSGNAVSLVCKEEKNPLWGIENLLKKNISRKYIEEFMPTTEVIDIKLGSKSSNKNKTKKRTPSKTSKNAFSQKENPKNEKRAFPTNKKRTPTKHSKIKK